jgi:hypothetical protein
MKNLQALKELTLKEFNKSKSSQKATNDYIIEVLLKHKELTRVEMTYEISLLRYDEITSKKLEEQDFATKEFQESWKRVNTTIKNSIDTNISKNNREPQYKDYVLKQNANKYYLESIKK